MQSKNQIPKRFGFHYYPDTDHYQVSDLKKWLPELQAVGAHWLVVNSPLSRAIPEPFLRGLIDSGIEPIIRYNLPLNLAQEEKHPDLLLNSYAKWGVRYVVLFDRPNLRLSWAANHWAQQNLVERFLDRFLPIAEACQAAGISPVFPPLEQGGDYWDTSFLRAALQGILRRNKTALFNGMILSAYAHSNGKPLSWGAGGPERWPGARPYFTPQGQEDQRGFHIFDWYLAISNAVLGKSLPIILFETGRSANPKSDGKTSEQIIKELEQKYELVQAAFTPLPAREQRINDSQERDIYLPSDVIACNFWLLAADEDSPHVEDAWFSPDGDYLPIIDDLRNWNRNGPANLPNGHHASGEANPPGKAKFISHYLLLPCYEWGIAEWHLEAIKPFVSKHQPTIGFSLAEAEHAEYVTVIGGRQTFSEEKLDQLRSAGCRVERITGDGTSIATQLATR